MLYGLARPALGYYMHPHVRGKVTAANIEDLLCYCLTREMFRSLKSLACKVGMLFGEWFFKSTL